MRHLCHASSQRHTLHIPHLNTLNSHVAAALEGHPGAIAVPRQAGAWGVAGLCVCLCDAFILKLATQTDLCYH